MAELGTVEHELSSKIFELDMPITPNHTPELCKEIDKLFYDLGPFLREHFSLLKADLKEAIHNGIKKCPQCIDSFYDIFTERVDRKVFFIPPKELKDILITQFIKEVEEEFPLPPSLLAIKKYLERKPPHEDRIFVLNEYPKGNNERKIAEFFSYLFDTITYYGGDIKSIQQDNLLHGATKDSKPNLDLLEILLYYENPHQKNRFSLNALENFLVNNKIEVTNDVKPWLLNTLEIFFQHDVKCNPELIRFEFYDNPVTLPEKFVSLCARYKRDDFLYSLACNVLEFHTRGKDKYKYDVISSILPHLSHHYLGLFALKLSHHIVHLSIDDDTDSFLALKNLTHTLFSLLEPNPQPSSNSCTNLSTPPLVCKSIDAIKKHRYKVFFLEELLSHKADPNAPCNEGCPPLHRTITNLRWTDTLLMVTEMLLSHGANPNLKDPYGNTALHVLARKYVLDPDKKKFFEKTARLLIQKGADPAIPDAHGLRPLDILKNGVDRVPFNVFSLFCHQGKEDKIRKTNNLF